MWGAEGLHNAQVMEGKVKISKRLKICFEVLFLRSGHKHPAQEKQISVFQNGYSAGLEDARFEYANEIQSLKEEIEELKYSE